MKCLGKRFRHVIESAQAEVLHHDMWDFQNGEWGSTQWRKGLCLRRNSKVFSFTERTTQQGILSALFGRS